MVKRGNMGEVVLKIDSIIIIDSTCPLYNGVLANVVYNVGGDPFRFTIIHIFITSQLL